MSKEENTVTGESLLRGLKQAVAHKQGNILLDSVEVVVIREKEPELSQEHFEAIANSLLETHKQPPQE
jgi:hypothetical protein